MVALGSLKSCLPLSSKPWTIFTLAINLGFHIQGSKIHSKDAQKECVMIEEKSVIHRE